MSNRIAISRIADRIELGAWAPPASRWRRLLAAARNGLRQALPQPDLFALSPHIRRDLGLADSVPAGGSAIDFAARRRGC